MAMPLQYLSQERPMIRNKRLKDMTLEDEPLRSEGIQHVTEEERRKSTSSSRTNEVVGPKWKVCSAADAPGSERKASQIYIMMPSLHHRTFLSLPGTSTAELPFGFGPTTSLALELLVLVLCSSSVACSMPSDLRGSSSSVISFSLLFLSMEFSWQRYWCGLPEIRIAVTDHCLQL